MVPIIYLFMPKISVSLIHCEGPTLKLLSCRIIISPSLLWWWKQYAPLKRRTTSTWLYGTTSQKTLMFINVFTALGHCTLTQTILIQSTHSHRISIDSIFLTNTAVNLQVTFKVVKLLDCWETVRFWNTTQLHFNVTDLRVGLEHLTPTQH
jgi:hypothetical protein